MLTDEHARIDKILPWHGATVASRVKNSQNYDIVRSVCFINTIGSRQLMLESYGTPPCNVLQNHDGRHNHQEIDNILMFSFMREPSIMELLK